MARRWSAILVDDCAKALQRYAAQALGVALIVAGLEATPAPVDTWRR